MDSGIAKQVSESTGVRSGNGGDKLLDRDATLERFAGDDTLLAEIAAVFIRTVPQLVTALGAAVAANDLKQIHHQAHSLKGAVAAFQAPLVVEAVMAVEKHAKAGDAAAAAAAYPIAQALVQRLLGELASIAALQHTPRAA
jgi:HPt (histidine-containing phosphotransfer) domain-containing protein